MGHFFAETIDAELLGRIQESEQIRYRSLVQEIEEKFGAELRELGIDVEFHLDRWDCSELHKNNHAFDGYTAVFRAVFLSKGRIMQETAEDYEFDFFVHLNTIEYRPIRKAYRIFEEENFERFFEEINYGMEDLHYGEWHVK